MELVTGAMGSLIPKLWDLLKDEYKLQAEVKNEVRSLAVELECAHAALRKVADVRPDQLDELVRIWAREVRESSYDMEDILDTNLIRVEGSHKPHERESLLKSLAEKMTRLFKDRKERHKITDAIEKIKKNLQEVSERHGRFTASSIVAKPAASARTVDPRLTAMYREASQIIGIDNSSADLMFKLSLKGGDESNQKMKIVSVVGIGGLGKTTLAKAVYDKLKSKFGYGAFVPVGQNPDVKKVFRDILIDLDKEEYTMSKYTTLDERQLINELHDFLGSNRYFVVIDDIWEPQSWEAIKLALVENNCGSRIIITTRKFEVAKQADEVYELDSLSHYDSKKLFFTRLFGGEDKCPNNHVVKLSDMILKKCGGVPLAIITMASLLLGKSREEWIEVCKSPGFYQDKDDWHMANTMYILSLSYYDLPSNLKTCLLYLTVFPEDSLIDKDSLIWMWIAEGFVEMKPGHESFVVGEQYFHDLINRSLIQGVDSEGYGIMDSCRIHDMVLDLILSISKEENFVTVDGTLTQRQTRRLAPRNTRLDLTRDSTHVNVPQVRSFIAWRCSIVNWAHPRLELIRVLALEGCTFPERGRGLENIGNLLHLRYLRVWFFKLPEKIGGLKFLQTLDLLNGYGGLELPCSIGHLTQLVCLRALGAIAPVGVVGKLTALEELQIGGSHDREEFQRQFVKDLANQCELRVLKLHIRDWNMDDNMQIDLVQSLDNLKKMQHLKVDYALVRSVNMSAWDAAMPSKDLRCLFLGSICFPKLPSWISSAHLPSLSHLDLAVMDVDEQGLKALGRLPELCYLRLYSVDATTCISTESDGCFQKLVSLLLPDSMVQFVANEDSTSIVLVGSQHGGMANGKRRKKDKSSLVIMPSLEELQLWVNVEQLMQNTDVSCGDLGLEYLPSIRKVKVNFDCNGAFEDEVEREVDALRHAIEDHPNRPAFITKYSLTEYMKRRSDNGGPVQPRNKEEETPLRLLLLQTFSNKKYALMLSCCLVFFSLLFFSL